MTWTYNQGIVLSGLSKLYKYTGDEELFKAAENLIDSVIASDEMVPSNSGVLVESCDPSGTCDQDQWMFKGVFFGHLGYFLADMASLERLSIATRTTLVQKYAPFIRANATAVWNNARGPDGRIGAWWAAPPESQFQKYSVESHGSGVAAVLCAMRMDQLLHYLETPMVQADEGTAPAGKRQS